CRYMAPISTGCNCIDQNIGGGIQSDSIILVYGEPETGKSTFALQCAVNCAIQGGKILYVDCDNTFSTERLLQIAGYDFNTVSERIVLVKPRDFREQTVLTEHIEDYAVNVGLIIFDTFTALYSAKAAESPKAFSTNRELNRQLALLAQLTKTKKIPLVINSQVRSIISEQSTSVRPVATRVLNFWADNVLLFKPTDFSRVIQVIIEKAPGLTAEVACYVQIGAGGLTDA
ncbi:MAG: AAA family ATPase, partial [Candidatus Bathyarchaeia archaeon]